MEIRGIYKKEDVYEKIIIGKKDNNKEYDFRETCFGIVVMDNKLYCTTKNNEYSLIGGGVKEGEDHIQCLKWEFLEEAGLVIEEVKPLCTIDCFWTTRENRNMESLSNIYIVTVSDEIIEPTENVHKLQKVNLKDSIDLFPLPYHKRALEEFLNYTK